MVESLQKVIPGDSLRVGMGDAEIVTPFQSRAIELVRGKQDPLTVKALSYVQFLSNGTEPIVSVHGFGTARECQGTHLHEL